MKRRINLKPHRVRPERANRLEGVERGIFRIEHALIVLEHAPVVAWGTLHFAPHIAEFVAGGAVIAILCYAVACIWSHFS